MIESVWVWVIAALLIAVAGVLGATDTAIGRISRSRVDEISKDNPSAAARLRPIVDDRARYVNVLLFLQLACSTLALVLLGQWFVGRHPESPWTGVFIATLVGVVVGYIALGVAPRTLGRQYAERIALGGAGPTRLLASLLNPLTQLLIVVGNALTPGKGFRQGPFTSTAELRELVDQAEADMLIEDDERRMIHSVFELGDTVAREVMVPRTEMVWIESTKTLGQGLSLGLRSGFSRIPVAGRDVDDIVGVVYLKDLVRRVINDRAAETTAQIASIMRAANFVPDSKPVDELLRDMQSARVHLSVVVDEYGGTAGILTIEDIIEEIVGEIDDEYDTSAPEIQRLDDGSFRVSARLHVEDLAELLGIDIDADEEGIDTVGGLLGKRLGRVPIPGSEVVIDGWRLRAERALGRRHRIGEVVATRVVEQDEAHD